MSQVNYIFLSVRGSYLFFYFFLLIFTDIYIHLHIHIHYIYRIYIYIYGMLCLVFYLICLQWPVGQMIIIIFNWVRFCVLHHIYTCSFFLKNSFWKKLVFMFLKYFNIFYQKICKKII